MKMVYGILGYPLVHSYSPDFFNRMFETKGINAEYLKFETSEISDIHQILHSHPNLAGFNVTIPHKQAIIPFLDDISQEAEDIGAVNCVKVSIRNFHPYLTGYNTDTLGFGRALSKFIPSNLKQALILGNGGAAKAVRYTLKQMQINSITVSRTPQETDQIGYTSVDEYLTDHLLIVNTTPLGTFPNIKECPVIPYHHLTSHHYLFDLVYNPSNTLFMQLGAQYGAYTCNGYAMWKEQAICSWKIWNNII